MQKKNATHMRTRRQDILDNEAMVGGNTKLGLHLADAVVSIVRDEEAAVAVDRDAEWANPRRNTTPLGPLVQRY